MNPIIRGGPFWTPITPQTGSFSHAESHEGGANWASIASLVETCKLNGADPQRYLADLLTRLVNNWPQARIDELMPWCWAATNPA